MERTISSRCKYILKVLLDSNEPITIGKLEKIVGVSNKTISNDLDLLEHWLASHGGKLVRKPNVGILLEVDNDIKMKLYDLVNTNSYYLPNTPEERQNYILMRLLDLNDYITIQDLADEIYVSKSTINRDLTFIEQWLNTEGLKLIRKPNKGLKVCGSEKNMRSAIASLLSKTITKSEWLGVIEDYNGHVDYYISKEAKDFFSSIDLSIIERSIRKIERKLPYRFSDSAFTALIIHIAIAITRINAKKEIKLFQETIDALKDKPEYKLAKEIIKDLEQEFNIIFPEAEAAYITMHILGGKVQQNLLDENNLDDLIKLNIDNRLFYTCKMMIDKASEILNIELSYDRQLLMGLLLHIHSAINRLLYNLPIKNPFLEEIKKLYPIDFEAALYACDVVKDEYDLEMNEDEIAYIAMHFGAARERYYQKDFEKLKVILVCGSGLGSSQLLASKLRRTFPDLDIVDIVSVIDLKRALKEKKPNMIITTIPLINYELPTILVNPFLGPNDIEKIKMHINKVSLNDEDKLNIKSGEFKKLIDKRLIFPDMDFKSKEEVIKHMVKSLHENGYVKDGYYKSVMDREKVSPTSYGNIAIPHAFPGYVIESKIALCILKEPIDWDGNKVDIVFMLAIENKRGEVLDEIFDHIYEIIDDKEKINKLKSIKSNEEIVKFLVEVE